ncbi:CoA transferase [Candidatus Amarobacter glycogenicus]|uniref:CaiB/BaiF CoA transferase family protein n=1 Tax=Candidatus Amarobacter glycogenicus TaxID=3140699 RepID=UPI002A10B262|nr:CoA transferase [Dehalococcoidia bacterium]MBK9612382.1 CoA transferase [Dehalococcoidia bacterium]
MPLPLDGFRIIDCSTVLAGPLAATHLGDFGADVIKVELPQSDPLPMRATRLHEERNKRSITADLRTEEGQDILLRLIRDADALIENFRPGTFEKWNLGPDRLLKENPRLIIHRLSAFGQTGPWSSLGGYDRQAQAISGATYVTGFPDSEPVRSGFATADYMAGIWGAFSIILAAYWRDARGGTGQVSDLALFEPMLRASEGSITEFGLSGSVRERAGNSNPGVVPASNFRTRDGVTVAINANNDRQWARLARVIGRADLAVNEDYRMASRLKHAEEIYALIGEWVGARDVRTVEAAMVEAGVPCAPVLNVRQILEHPMIRGRGSIVNIPWEETDLAMVAPLPRLSASPGEIRSAAPRTGQHTVEVLKGIGFDANQIAELAERGIIGKPTS